MASQDPKLHFVLFPMMAQGHMIPMMDIAKILAQHHNVMVTIVTTPHNASRYTSILARYLESGLHIQLVQLKFPFKESGLPEGCENLDMLPSLGAATNFFNSSKFLQQEVEKLFEELTPSPTCIISDMCLPYTVHIARKFNIPRISFGGINCLYLLCLHNLHVNNIMQTMANNEFEYFDVPGIPDKIEINIAQTGLGLKGEAWEQFNSDLAEAEMGTYGVIMNSFEELEPAYAREFKKVKNDKVWCIGPVSLSNTDYLDKIQRGNNNKVSIDEWEHLKWLDSQKQGSVLYACLGSLCNITPLQLIELGLALEATKIPFIWVLREGNELEELKKWIEESGFEERINGRGLVIKGWAPQLLILSHLAIGGFLTHCGWNSTLEAICAGVPMVTWPLFADQFLNECLVVQILKVGVKIGVKSPMKWGEEEDGVLVKKEDIERGIEKLMDETSECKERRKRIRELAEMAKKAVEKGGSSHSNISLFIQDIMKKNKDMMSSFTNGNANSK
ncbi:putative hexosyltransferase [Medicago truncatula]|uniref:Glycosyltransferase n=2 Tax=Medicago truncatula TaxID=3880 RepID=G7L4W6_MEDTR|nr:UDP-glycosyltransferase 73C1 [Medicago truncatula]AES81933.1 UDP-glucosyltransferase family protein [Medicago truncatula]RHN48557.1 putative hexosyltransferase [Medicago truncatula]